MENIENLLKDKGLEVEGHLLEEVNERWVNLLKSKGSLSQVEIEDHDISLINIPGSDHIER